MRKPISFIIFLTVIIVVLSVIQVVVSNRLSTTGVILGKLQDELTVTKTENEGLTQSLLVASSLTNIASRASELGFTNHSKTLVISPLPLAQKP